jgi:hypothetical protein
MAAHALFASAANQHAAALTIPLARVDLQNNPGMARQLHATGRAYTRPLFGSTSAHLWDRGCA